MNTARLGRHTQIAGNPRSCRSNHIDRSVKNCRVPQVQEGIAFNHSATAPAGNAPLSHYQVSNKQTLEL